MTSQVVQVQNKNHQDPYTEQKIVNVTPEETQRSVSYQAPTPEMQEYIQKNIIEPTQKAYGINPATGDVTPFQALGYNPEDECKRREAEMALNDRKRKENAWYNAFAVVGDALTAGLGGNVWQRQPNRIGAQANADNQRLIAEQKAEDMNNAAILRNAGVKYADAVNRLIQNYLTKTTTTNKTGGDRTETTVHGAQNGFRTMSHVVRNGDDNEGSSSRKSGSSGWKNNGTYQIGLVHDGKLQYRDITGQQAKNIVNHAKTLYEKMLVNSDDSTRQAILDLLGSNIVQEDPNKPGKYDWDDDALLRSGYIFDADKGFRNGILQDSDKTIRQYYREITGDQTDYTELADYDLITPAARAIQEARSNSVIPKVRTTTQQGAGRLSKNDRSATR